MQRALHLLGIHSELYVTYISQVKIAKSRYAKSIMFLNSFSESYGKQCAVPRVMQQIENRLAIPMAGAKAQKKRRRSRGVKKEI